MNKYSEYIPHIWGLSRISDSEQTLTPSFTMYNKIQLIFVIHMALTSTNRLGEPPFGLVSALMMMTLMVLQEFEFDQSRDLATLN